MASMRPPLLGALSAVTRARPPLLLPHQPVVVELAPSEPPLGSLCEERAAACRRSPGGRRCSPRAR